MLYDVEMTLGKRIRAARKRLVPELTQKAIGDAFGISDQAVSSWERDETIPDPAKIPELRRLLRVTYIWLFEGAASDPPNPEDAEVRLGDLAPAERAAVRAMVEAFHKQRGRAA